MTLTAKERNDERMAQFKAEVESFRQRLAADKVDVPIAMNALRMAAKHAHNWSMGMMLDSDLQAIAIQTRLASDIAEWLLAKAREDNKRGIEDQAGSEAEHGDVRSHPAADVGADEAARQD